MTLFFRSLVLSTLLVLSTSLWLHAETVPWTMGRTIDVQIPLSTEDTINSRTIVFVGATKLMDVKTFHEDKDLVLMPAGNTIIARLVNPGFTGNVQVFDDAGDLYILRITAATAVVDETLFIRKPEPPPAVRKSSAGNRDALVAGLVSHMLGGRRMPGITGAVVSTLDADGKVIPGQSIYRDDTFVLTLVRAWNSGQYHGYQCTLAVSSERPLILSYQRLRFPGAIGVHCPEIVTLDPKNPAVNGEPGQVLNLFYVAR